MQSAKRRNSAEFGDFQTPVSLAKAICNVLCRRGLAPASVVEPSCGLGSLLLAALEGFGTIRESFGLEIHGPYLDMLRVTLTSRGFAPNLTLIEGSFFDQDWSSIMDRMPEPILAIGNPPWVTNASLGALESNNLPRKANLQGLRGLDALTGKSNFDISEWMMLALLAALAGREATMAMVCKTGVARKLLAQAWKAGAGIADAEMHRIDAPAIFGAAVDACVLFCILSPTGQDSDCRVFRRLGDAAPSSKFGYREGRLIADLDAYGRRAHLATDSSAVWRSGIKHDCSKVMEFRRDTAGFRNGLDETVDLELDYMYPMLKSSEIREARADSPSRWMLVPQRVVGDDTSVIRTIAPKTWNYLRSHAEAFDRRSSTIYRGRPGFSVFGVGEYSFAPWKVAISGFYKKLDFTVVGGFADKPIVLDDTAYFLPFASRDEALGVAALLNSAVARDFFSAFVFWDAKRPITADLLRRLDLQSLARELGVAPPILGDRERSNGRPKELQRTMFDA